MDKIEGVLVDAMDCETCDMLETCIVASQFVMAIHSGMLLKCKMQITLECPSYIRKEGVLKQQKFVITKGCVMLK